MTAETVRARAVAAQRRERGGAWDALVPEEGWTVGRIVEDAIETTLASLTDPVVVDGAAEVLTGHQFIACPFDAAFWLPTCSCGWVASTRLLIDQRRHVARAVVEWITGGAG